MTPDELLKTCNELQVQLIQTQTQLAWAMEQIRLLTHQKFGSGADKVAYPEGSDQLSFFNEPEAAADFSVAEPDLSDVLADTKKPRNKKSKGKRKQDFSNLPTIVIEHELPESERICPNCLNLFLPGLKWRNIIGMSIPAVNAPNMTMGLI